MPINDIRDVGGNSLLGIMKYCLCTSTNKCARCKEIDILRSTLIAAGERIASQAELLGKRAEKSGLERDAEVCVNEHGGKQSALIYRADLLPPAATLAVSSVLKHGADKYGPRNWRLIDVHEHINHALVHVLAHNAGDTQDDHLEHAACRMLMALEIKLVGKDNAEASAKPDQPDS